jgi:hypothetical protein
VENREPKPGAVIFPTDLEGIMRGLAIEVHITDSAHRQDELGNKDADRMY